MSEEDIFEEDKRQKESEKRARKAAIENIPKPEEKEIYNENYIFRTNDVLMDRLEKAKLQNEQLENEIEEESKMSQKNEQLQNEIEEETKMSQKNDYKKINILEKKNNMKIKTTANSNLKVEKKEKDQVSAYIESQEENTSDSLSF